LKEGGTLTKGPTQERSLVINIPFAKKEVSIHLKGKKEKRKNVLSLDEKKENITARPA